jgi:hypothetical protein
MPQEFPLFMKLPFELRSSIWHYALSIPRIHEITYDARGDSSSNLPPPSLLHVCRESRAEALKMLQSGFGTYINFDLDILFPACKKDRYTGYRFGVSNAHTTVLKAGQDRDIACLAIPLQLWKWRSDLSLSPGSSLCGSKGVKEVVLWGEYGDGKEFLHGRGVAIDMNGAISEFESMEWVAPVAIDCDVEKDVLRVLEKAKVLIPGWKVPNVRYLAVTAKHTTELPRKEVKK